MHRFLPKSSCALGSLWWSSTSTTTFSRRGRPRRAGAPPGQPRARVPGRAGPPRCLTPYVTRMAVSRGGWRTPTATKTSLPCARPRRLSACGTLRWVAGAAAAVAVAAAVARAAAVVAAAVVARAVHGRHRPTRRQRRRRRAARRVQAPPPRGRQRRSSGDRLRSRHLSSSGACNRMHPRGNHGHVHARTKRSLVLSRLQGPSSSSGTSSSIRPRGNHRKLKGPSAVLPPQCPRSPPQGDPGRLFNPRGERDRATARPATASGA